MNLVIYQKIDKSDPRSFKTYVRNREYARKRELRLFAHEGDDIFKTTLQEMKVDDECEGALILKEYSRLTVDNLEKRINGQSCVYEIPRDDPFGKFGLYFFRKDSEGLMRLEEFTSNDPNIEPPKKEGPLESKEPKKTKTTKTTKSKKKQKTE